MSEDWNPDNPSLIIGLLAGALVMSLVAGVYTKYTAAEERQAWRHETEASQRLAQPRYAPFSMGGATISILDTTTGELWITGAEDQGKWRNIHVGQAYNHPKTHPRQAAESQHTD